VHRALKNAHMSIQGSGEHPTFPAQGRVWALKDEKNQRSAADVSSFVSRSASDLAAERNMGTYGRL
jgi:hypothetical protein